MIKIVTDTTCDMPSAWFSQYHITTIPMNIQFGLETFHEGVTITQGDFYQRIETGGIFPTTSQPSVGEFTELYEALAADDSEILSIHLTSKLSGTWQSAYLAAQQLQGKIKGRLTIGGSTIPAGYILPPLLGKFKESYPEVVVTLVQGDTERVIRDTLQGNVELGIVGAKAQEVQLSQKKIVDDEMFLVVPRKHKWAGRRHVAMDEVFEEPFIMRELGSGTRKSIEQVLDKAGHPVGALNIVAEMGSTEAIRQGIKAGVGVSILSECAVAEELAAKTLNKLKIQGLSFKRAFYLTVHRHRTQSPLCRTFIDFLNRQKETN